MELFLAGLRDWDSEIRRRLVEEAVERARGLLETHRVALDHLATRLFEKETIEADEIAARRTPVPGGVGLLTVAMLMSNTLKAAKLRRGLESGDK